MDWSNDATRRRGTPRLNTVRRLLAVIMGAALLAATPAAAQIGSLQGGQLASALQNQLVVRGDGAIYLIRDGARHLVTPASVSDDQLGTIPEGDPYTAGLTPADEPAPTTADTAPSALFGPANGPAPTNGTSPSTALPSAVHVTLNEWSILPEATTLAAGKVTFDVTDTGKFQHEMVILKSDKDPAGLPVSRSRVDEGAVGPKVGEIEGLHTGDSKAATFDLKPGSYILLCNLSNHYTRGMVQQIEVK